MRRRRWAWALLVGAATVGIADVLSIWLTLLIPVWKNLAFGVSRGAFGVVSSNVADVADHLELSRASTNEQFYWWFDSGGIMGVGYVIAPLWLPFLLALSLGGWLWRASRVQPAWLCSQCGYDRRGLPGAVPCPECGTCPSSAQPDTSAARNSDDAAQH